MKRLTIYIYLMCFLISSCASTGSGLKILEEPKPNLMMIIGNVVVENIDQEFAFKNWGMSAKVIIIGKTGDGTINRYSVDTDDKGYYCIPNLPVGSYVLKAVILPVVGGKYIKIVNDLNSADSKFYRMRHPERPFEYSTAWFPPESQKSILNFHVIWLGLRKAHISNLSEKSVGEVLMGQSEEGLFGKRFYETGFPYTREDPKLYFKKKFPESEWWSL